MDLALAESRSKCKSHLLSCGPVYLLMIVLTIWLATSFVTSTGPPECDDFLMLDVCEAYDRWAKCHLHEARVSCRRTCGVCGDGWSAWSAWGACSQSCNGTETRTRFCKSQPSHCPGDDINTQNCSSSSCDILPTTPAPTLTTRAISDVRCNGTHFLCDSVSNQCIENSLVCDGFSDCPTGSDEVLSHCMVAANTNHTFQIRNELEQVCMEVIINDPAGPINGVRAYRRCPSDLNPQRPYFLWRWWRSFHLINLGTGRCLEAKNPAASSNPTLTSEPCENSQLNQKWVCDDRNTEFLLVRLKKLTQNYSKRYISLGEDYHGWPPVLSSNDSQYINLWQRGPIEPPITICGPLQVYWSDWSTWSSCSTTCVGGRKSHTRHCINGRAGVSPCSGSSEESSPCNGHIACIITGTGSANSRCGPSWSTLENAHRLRTTEYLDPSCYKIFPTPHLNYTEAGKHCRRQRSFLGSMKEESAQTKIVEMLEDLTVTEKIYIGIEENFFTAPIEGHQLRFDLDDTPVGHFKPWNTDCVLGPGYDYTGTVSETSSGYACQAWDSSDPHTVNFQPKGDNSHNYCRNPNLDPQGPWCYTTNDQVEKEFCEIPQCLATDTSHKLSESSEFRLANPCKSEAGEQYGYAIAAGPNSLLRRACGPRSVTSWAGVAKSSKFVWDQTRTKIMNLQYEFCMEAATLEPGARVTLEECDALKLTQKWKPVGRRLVLSHSSYDTELNLDLSVDQTTLSVSSYEASAWTISRASGHFVNVTVLRSLFADDAFYLYSINDKKCITVNSTDNPKEDAASELSYSGTITLKDCEFLPAMRWMKFMSTQMKFMNLHASLCLAPDKLKAGSKINLVPCHKTSVQWKCNDDLEIMLQSNEALYLTVKNGSIIVDHHSTDTRKWTIWETKNRTICNIQVPRGNIAIGSKFAIRNALNDQCLQTDDTGNVFTKECAPMGSNKFEIWRFTESPSMIMHYATRRCLSTNLVRYGSAVLSKLCNIWDSNQHWTLFPRPTNVLGSQNKFPFFSFHLLADTKYVLIVDGPAKVVKIKDDTTHEWVAFNKYSRLASLSTMTDCIIANGTFKFYLGNVSTTITGKSCLPWSEEDKETFPELQENFCRNPGNISDDPWCYANDNKKTREYCLLISCPSSKVAIDKDGKWYAVPGHEKMSFVCQAEPECYRGIGLDYIGAWNNTPSGLCVPWSDHIDQYNPEHNYCRNPNNSPLGPWCYTAVAIARIVPCPIPQCHPTCANIPHDLYHAETVQHKFSATVYGVEVGSVVITQCHRGYWYAKEQYRDTTTCVQGDWQPEPIHCKAITCYPLSILIPETTPLARKTAMYGETSSFMCNEGLLAGAGKLTISFRCNNHGEWEDLENQQRNCTPACDPGWKQFRSFCHKINETRLNFNDALAACKANGGTLADIDDKIEFDFLKDMLFDEGSAVHGDDTLYWAGVKHYPKSPPPTDPMWRDWRSINALNKFEVEDKKGANYLPFLYTMFYVMHYMHNRYTTEFDDILAYNLRCMYVDAKELFVATRGCYDYPKEKMLWMWISPYHLYNVPNKMCLTGFSVNGYARDDIKESAKVETCDIGNNLQFVGCRRHGSGSSLKLLFNENSYFVDDVTQPWDKVQMAGGFYAGNYSRWVLNTTDFDVCHHSIMMTGNAFLLWEGTVAAGNSYTFAEAQDKCREHGAELATEDQLADKVQSDDISSCSCAWGDGNVAFSVSKTKDSLCHKSAPSGGVKQCTPTPTKADAWCYKGTSRSLIDIPWAVAIWLHNSSREGVQERDSDKTAKFICKKESRWHCADPPDIYRATLRENILTSYSYLGTSAYKCDPGYWFERGVFIQTIICSPDLLWIPDPESLMCKLLDCAQPPDILYASQTVHGLEYLDVTEYRCGHGYWFAKDLFVLKVQCKEHGLWFPPPSSKTCSPIQCDLPPKIEHSTLDVYTVLYSYNASYTCDLGYWFAPGELQKDVTCNADGQWKPSPFYLKCWEVVCLPPPDQTHAVWDHIDEKTTVMSCAEGYEFKARNNKKPENMTHSVTLYCGDDGNWEPDANDYICVEIICDQPPDVAMTDDTRVMIENAKYDYDDEINYHCNPGYYLQYIFSLHSLNYKLCLYEGDDGLIYTSKSSCISAKALQFRWAEVEESRHPMQLREAASGRCLAAQEIPTESASFKPLTLQICNGSDVRHNWFCGDHEESYLILGLNASQEFYISIHMESNVVHTTKTSTEATEFVARKDKLMHLEIDVCRFRPRFFTQRTHCLKLGGWSPDPSLIKCEPIVCPDPPHVAYAKLKTDEAIFGYGSSVKYICNPGYEYLLERNTYVSRCSDMGTWVPDPTQLPCKKIRCPHYQLPAGAFVSSGNVANNLYNSKLTVSCQRGSQFKEGLSSMIVRCGPQKKWSPSHTVKECHLLKCSAPPDLANSTWTSLKPFLFNSLARYVCDNGHWIERGVTWKDTYCSETGLWIPDPERTIKCKIVECEDPGDVPNTLRHDVARPTDAFTFGSVVMYKCVTGRWFSRDLVKVSITCRDDANWYPPVTSLYCKEMTCLNPEPLPRYSFIIGYDHALGATLTVMCEPGYRIGGSAVSLTNNTEIQCMKTQKWEPDLSTIICHPLSCGEPGKVKFAHRLNSSNSFNSFAQYMCVAGYWMQPGMSSRLSQCKADGTWQPDPQSFVCKVVNCGHPGTFYNALSSVVKSGTLYGALVQIKCRDGYWTSHSYQKSVTLQCSDEGLWEPPPEGIHCIDVKCHEPANIVHAVRRLLPPHISSQVTSSDPITRGLFYTRGVRFKFRCDDGYEFAPQQYSIISSCTSHGNWSIQTKFLNCSLTSCPPPNAIIHGYVSENEGTSFESYFINSTFTYKCDEGFWFENKTFDMEVTCLKSGKWNRDIEYLFCFRVECKNPEPIDHGYFVISGTTYAHTTRYFCDDGYIESTPSVSTCSSSGDWLPSPPAIHCQAVDCGDLPTIPQASASDRNASVLYGSVVEYTCDTDHYFALGLQAINVTCDKNGKWTNSNKRCIDFRDFECQFPPGIPNSFYHSISSQSVNLHCDPGYFMRGDDANTTSQLMTCNGTGHWDPSELECVELRCPTPSVQGPHTVISRTSSAFNYSSVVSINCDSGHTLTLVPSGGPKQWLTSINVTCNQHAEWFPSLADIECRRVNCSAPPSVENAEVTYNSTELLDQASYHCLKNMSFGDKINKTVNCSVDGTWQPNPATFECSYHKCRVPVPPQYSTLSIKGQDYLNISAVVMLPELRVTCNTGYRVAGQANFTLSVSIECNPLGEWVSDPNLIECEEVTCDSFPNVSFILAPGDITAIAPFNYEDQLTYQCPSGQWFSPENVTHQMLRCSWDTTWQPSLANAECVGITCDYPPPVEHASLRGDDTRVGAEWTYTCDFGYRISAGVRGRATKCQTNGQWLPLPNSPQLRCEVIACDVPPVLPNIVNGTLLVLKPGQAYFDFREGVNFTYSCETGFWMSDGEIKQTSKNVMCLDGEWVPSPPTAIRCVIVVCDIAHPVRGARTDGVEHIYMSNITYSCARGQHFGYQRRRRLNVTCREDGRWHPNPHALWCSDVICKDLDLEGATKEQGGLRLDSTVIHTCPPTTWFGPQVSEIAATCDEDGRWSPSLEGKKCEDVSCGEPALDHILLQHNDFTYTSQVELECLGGYNLFPSTDPPVLMCDVSGSWYPDPRNYKCKPIECSLPRYIRHATVIGNNTYNSTVIVQCDPGFYIRRGTNWLEAVCMHDSTWSEDINSVFCIPLECLPLKQLPHSKLIRDTTLPSQAYNAVVKYQCHHGYWVDELVYSQSVRCNEIGMWEPPINFTCYEIKCKYPPNKRNSQIVIEGRVNLTEYPINSGMRYRCHNRSWVSAQHALAEWAFTGDVQVRMICSIKGMWKPHPDSFACREIEEGPLPVAYPRGLDQSQVKYEAWAEMEQILPNQILSHPYLQPVPIGQRGWYGGSSLKSSMVQDMNAVPSKRTASLLWDGKISTMWRPNRTEDRHYSFTLFLGGLYNVEGIELVTLNNRQEVLFIRANFSHDGKFFNDSIDTSKSRGRTGRVSDAISPIVVEKVPSSSNIILTITGFSHVAKFITITVTATRDLSYPPIIRELRFLGTPVRWEVVYPLDFLTTPLFTCIVSICFAVALLFARRWDESDKKKVQFGWDVSDCDNSSVDECYVIRLTCNDQLQAKHLVCRLVGDAANTELVLVNAPFKDKQLALLVPGSCGNLIRFEVGYVANDRPVLPANNVGPEIGVKIAELSPDKSLFGTLPWALNEASVSLVENEPISIRFFNKNTSRRSTLAKIQALDPLRWALYHIFTDHIFYTVFFKDFISQTTRVFRLLITFIGCCAALTISSILYKITHTMVFFESITSFGLGGISAFSSLPILVGLMLLFVHFPVYVPPEAEVVSEFVLDEKLVESEKRKFISKTSNQEEEFVPEAGDSVIFGEKGNFLSVVHSSFNRVDDEHQHQLEAALLGQGDMASQDSDETASSQIDPDLESLLEKFKHLGDFDQISKSKATTDVSYPSITDTLDTCMLPANYRKSLYAISEPDQSSICTSDLEAAYMSRTLRGHRRTRSAPAVLQYLGPVNWDSILPYVCCSLPHISDVDDAEILSCASMWSNESLVNKWHRLHRSVDQPIDDLFGQLDPKLSESHFSWHDPTYRRIPSDITKRGFLGSRSPPVGKWLKEFHREKAAAPIIEFGTYSDGEDSRPVVDTQSATTQIPLLSRMSASTQYPTGYALSWKRYSVYTQKPSSYVLSKNVRVQYPSLHVLERLPSGKRSSTSVESLNLLSSRRFEDREGFMSRKVPGDCTPSSSDTLVLVDEDDLQEEIVVPFEGPIQFRERPGEGSAGMVLRNRSHKKVVAFSTEHSRTLQPRLQPEDVSLVPSAGAFFSTSHGSSLYSDMLEDGDSIDVKSDTASHAHDIEPSVKSGESLVLNQTLAGSLKASGPCLSSMKKKNILKKKLFTVASPASALYKVTRGHDISFCIVCLAAACSPFILLGAGIDTIEKSANIAYLFFTSLVTFFFATLSLEAVLRWNIYRKWERLSLAYLRPIVHEGSSECGSASDLSSLVDTVDDK